MNLPNTSSPIWIFARQIIIAVLLGGFAMFAFNNKMSMADIVMIVSTMASIFGLDLVKHNAAPPAPNDDDK